MMSLIDQFKLIKKHIQYYYYFVVVVVLLLYSSDLFCMLFLHVIILHVIFDNKILNVCFCITSYGRVYTTDPYHALAPAAAYGVGAMVRIRNCLLQNISCFFGDFNEAMHNFLHVIMKNCRCYALW